MRIAFLTTEFGDFGRRQGGLGYYLARTTPLLAARGHECEVFLCSGVHGEETGDTLDYHGVVVRRLGVRPTPLDGIDLPPQVSRHLGSAWTIAEAIAEDPGPAFEVVQVPNFGVSGIFVDVPAPIVMRFSSHAPTWHAAAGLPRESRVVLSEMLQRRAIGNADLHFAPSRFVAELVNHELGLEVTVLRPPMPVDTDRRQWDESWARNVAGTAPYVVHAGQLGRAKGTDRVVEAAEIFLDESPRLQLHLCGRDAGAGPIIDALQARYPARVHFHGRVSPARLHPLMAGARAVISVSRADNLPNVVIEAMSLGTPVIGVRGASIDELVVDGDSGYLVPHGDRAALAAAVRRLLALSEVSQRAMAARSRARVLSLLDEQKTISALTRFYRHLAAAGVGRREPRDRIAAKLRVRLVATAQALRVRAGLAHRLTRVAARLRSE